jgi:hypothetical protein
MELDKYQLIELLVQDEERETFKAYDASNGRNVFLHATRPTANAAKAQELSELARSVLASGRAPEMLAVGDRGGRLCIVTDARPECRNIRQWLERNSGGNTQSGASDDDRMGRVAMWKAPQLENPPAEDATKKDSSFTKAFGALGSSQPSPAAPLAEPGEFTRLFQSPAPPNRPAEAGDFTRRFSAGQFGERPDPVPSVNRPVEKHEATEKEPGAFTKMFQPPASPTRFPDPPPPPDIRTPAIPSTPTIPKPPDQTFSSEFSAVPEPAVAPWNDSTIADIANDPATEMVKPRVSIPPPPVAPAAEPSESSRVIAIPTQPKIEAPKPPTPAAEPPSVNVQKPAAPATPSYVPLIVIMACLLLMAAMLILYFATRR